MNMLISHKYKFIFIKTKKTAGTSIEISLSRYCGEEDVITKISPQDEKVRNELAVKPQNYENKFFNHIGARKIIERIEPFIWDSYYKFCFDRNPWDKVISLYYYICDPEEVSFQQFLESGKFKRAYNFPMYTINDKLAVDFIGKYENLEEDLQKVCQDIGIPFDGWLPNAKGNFRKVRDNYRDMYNDEQKEVVHQYYKNEIELLGYKF
jgi:Sulfotransferase family